MNFLIWCQIEKVATQTPMPALSRQREMSRFQDEVLPFPDQSHVCDIESVSQYVEKVVEAPYALRPRDFGEQPVHPCLDRIAEDKYRSNNSSQDPATDENVGPYHLLTCIKLVLCIIVPRLTSGPVGCGMSTMAVIGR